MRKVELRMNEDYKYNVIKKLVETNSNKKSAALKLNCSSRTINRLIKLYKNEGKSGFVHKNRNRKPSTAFSREVRDMITHLYIDDYSDTNLTHFCEIVYKDFGISISDNTINKWLKELYIVSPKAKRLTKKNMRITLNHMQANSKKASNQKVLALQALEYSDAHPRRPRSKYMGEMIQMDASQYEWVPNQIWHLHVAIDDASSTIVGAYFDTQETLNGYYNVFYQILTNYGIPAMFYTDKRTVFEYKRKDTLFDNEDTFTQFSYAAHQLGVQIKTTSIAQAKGRVERLNQTLQSRLPIELRRANISSIEQANEFLDSYIKEFNKQFALHLNDTLSVFEIQPTKELINTTLAILDKRVIDGGHSIKYKNNYYIPVDSRNEKQYFNSKTKCMVIQTFDDELLVNIDDIIYGLAKIEKHEITSKEFDSATIATKEPKKYIPPITHPWKQASFNRYLATKKHREEFGVNV